MTSIQSNSLSASAFHKLDAQGPVKKPSEKDFGTKQAQHHATSASKPEYNPDYDGLSKALGHPTTPQTRVDTQLLAEDETSYSIARDKFFAFQSMSWQEKVRAMILKSMGLNEEGLQAMSIEDREKIEEKIREKTKEKIEEDVEEKTGVRQSIPLAGTAKV